MRKLYRSQRDKKLFGVCGGLAEWVQVDATLLRLVLVVTTFFTGGALIPIYILAALIIPKEPGFTPMASGWHGSGAGPQYYGSQHNGFTAGFSSSFTERAKPGAAAASEDSSGLDHMMKDIESKAMWNEIQDLKAKLAKYEKGDV